MRVNSYNKFFTEVAKIMNTEVKSVKQLDGRYKVELANHVCLNVYRGVSGSLFIHDHRGVSHITSCYDFDDFKTMKDLYERLITDFGEDSIENVECAKEQYFDTDCLELNNTIIAKIENINYCPNQNTCCIVSPFVHCDYNYKSDNCIKAHKNFIHDCEQVHKQMKAINNPNWHNVNLATLANIDNDMLDEKRRDYMYLYNLIKDFRKYAFEIIRKDVYFETTSNVFRNIQQLYFNNVISFTTYDYAAKHIQAVGVEKGWFDSKSEETFGYKESRRYKVTLR